jgi:hypothetical protein
MNFKLLLKPVFLVVILLLLVVMGMNNRQTVWLSLPPLLPNQKLPAALMYFCFFGVGLVTGTVLSAGKKGSGGSKSKGQK